jgi:hypothetical protein
MSTHCVIWEPIPGIATPCADISFQYDAPNCLHVLMRFSNVANGPTEDLALEFGGPILLRWEDETISRDDLGLAPLPKCQEAPWSGRTFPLLHVLESPWLASLDGYPSAEGRQHFKLVSMNDIIDVIARSHVNAKWVAPK